MFNQEPEALILPSDDELRSAITALMTAIPDLGKKRLLRSVRSNQPTWLVTEKRCLEAAKAVSGGTRGGDNIDADAVSDTVPETAPEPALRAALAKARRGSLS